jgi:hypothetical protein
MDRWIEFSRSARRNSVSSIYSISEAAQAFDDGISLARDKIIKQSEVEQAIPLLVESRADLNELRNGETYLSRCVFFRFDGIAHGLLECNANPNIACRSFSTLEMAAMFTNPEMFELLLQYGAASLLPRKFAFGGLISDGKRHMKYGTLMNTMDIVQPCEQVDAMRKRISGSAEKYGHPPDFFDILDKRGEKECPANF